MLKQPPRLVFNANAFRSPVTRAAAPKAHHADVAPVKRFLMVGAEIAANELWITDQSYLRMFIRMLDVQGIPVSDAPEIIALNLNYGHDFLKNPVEADVCSFNYLFYHPAAVAHTAKGFTNQSALSAHTALWHEQLLKTGARFAFNVHGGGSELPTDIIAQAPYEYVAQQWNFVYFDMLARKELGLRGPR